MRRWSVATAAALATLVSAGPGFGQSAPSQSPAQAVPVRNSLFDASRGVLTYAPVVASATAAVVNISVSGTRQQSPLLQDPFFRRFFGGGPGEQRQSPERVTAAGSGVIIDAGKGYVVTNNHVVENADKITVTAKDGRQLDAKLVGRDAETDIALVRVDASGLSALPVGDSEKLQVGDVVLAIGNPFGLGQTVTSGIVGALGRSGLNSEHYESFIQTDAPINPGNSGGALIDSKGELVGINTAIIAPGGGNVGIGFAVPSSMVTAIVGQLERYGEVKRGRIGVAVQTVTPAIASNLGLGEARGVVVSSVERNSPAARAGLKAGDVIVAADGEPLKTSAQLRNDVGLKELGSSVKLSYLRNGQQQDVSVAIEKAPERADRQATLPQLAGATFATRPAQTRGGQGQGSGAGGDGQSGQSSGQEVVVSGVERPSPAYFLGLRTGDVIESVNQNPVHSIGDLQHAAQRGGALALAVRRGDAELLLFLN